MNQNSKLRNEMIVGQLAMLEETIQYYNDDTTRRALLDGDCKYVTGSAANERYCAVGRKLPEALKQQVRNGVLSNGASSTSLIDTMESDNCEAFNEWRKTDEYLFLTGRNEDYKVHESYNETGLLELFSEHLQLIHDRSSFWKPDGLSELGHEAVEKFRKVIKAGTYTTPHDTYDDGNNTR